MSVLFRRVLPDELVSYSSTYMSFLNSRLLYCRLLSVLHFEPLDLVPHGTNRVHDACNSRRDWSGRCWEPFWIQNEADMKVHVECYLGGAIRLIVPKA